MQRMSKEVKDQEWEEQIYGKLTTNKGLSSSYEREVRLPLASLATQNESVQKKEATAVTVQQNLFYIRITSCRLSTLHTFFTSNPIFQITILSGSIIYVRTFFTFCSPIIVFLRDETVLPIKRTKVVRMFDSFSPKVFQEAIIKSHKQVSTPIYHLANASFLAASGVSVTIKQF